jgi:2-oxo-hept-3-ene-1,7-dioate hydratase
MLTDEQVRQAAENLWQAEQSSEWAEPLSILFPEADVADAYRVGLAVRDIKLANGRTVKGHKIGLTSKAMRDLTGATEPDYGFIFDNWFTLEGQTVQRSAMNRPLVEVELAFVMGRELKGPSINAADVIRATDFILPALEIVDSRYRGRQRYRRCGCPPVHPTWREGRCRWTALGSPRGAGRCLWRSPPDL